MALDLTYEALIRSGSGLMFALAGLFMLLRGAPRRFTVALGVHFAAFGLFLALTNLTSDAYWWALAPLNLVDLAASWLVLGHLLSAATRRARIVTGALASAAAALSVAVLLVAWPLRGDPGLVGPVAPAGRFVAYVALFPFMLSWAMVLAWIPGASAHWRAASLHVPRDRALLLVAAIGGVDFCVYAGEVLHDWAVASRAGNLLAAFSFLALTPLVFGFLLATGTARGRLPRNLFLTCVAALVLGAFFDPYDDLGAIGIVRILLFVVLAFAVFRLDLLGVPLPAVTANLGSLASLGLAALFITAQLAENALNNALGAVTGGVVAGIVVFAAFPLQRAVERRVEARMARSRTSDADAYRAQARIAWRDGHISAAERVQLRHLRARLGLTADEAERIDHEVEEEAAHATRPRNRSAAPTSRGTSARRAVRR